MKSKKTKLTIKHSIEVFWDEESKQFVGISKELEYTGMGKTPDEARDNTNKAVELALQWCAENGTLEEVLEEAGYEIYEIDRKKVWDHREHIANFPAKVFV